MATIEKVLSIKFPFIRDLGIGINPFYNSSYYLFFGGKWFHKQRICTERNNIKTDSFPNKIYFMNLLLLLLFFFIPIIPNTQIAPFQKSITRINKKYYSWILFKFIQNKSSSIGTIPISSKRKNQGIFRLGQKSFWLNYYLKSKGKRIK
mgnify:CR=1 FL=1